ncbi:MAG: hypothetical protein RLZZ440_1842 [Planctomycetota bacterium]
MFIARSQARIRAARFAFLLLAAIPTAVIVGWAAYVRSDLHRAAVERDWQRATGLPLTVGRIDHPRPGVTRGCDCLLPAAEDRPAVAIESLEVESSADEDRIRLGSLTCDHATAAAVAGLARGWLLDDVRFGRTCLIEIAGLRWADAPTEQPFDLKIECVARAGSRAMRIVRRGSVTDELRIVRQPPADPASPHDRLAIDAAWATPVPLAVVAAAAGLSSAENAAASQAAWLTGELKAEREAGRWRGAAHGRIVDLDLATVAAAIGGEAAGRATVDITRLTWADSRLSDGLIECGIGPGWIDARLFDRIVLATGSRPGPAVDAASTIRGFDTAAWIATIGGEGLQLLPAARLPGALAVRQSGVVLAPPPGPVPGDRLAWMLTRPGTAFGPAVGPGAWLMSVLPAPAPPAGGPGRQF